MYNTKIDNLLNELSETTSRCDELTVLSESMDSDNLGIIQKRLFSLQNTLLDCMATHNPMYMTPDTIELIKKVRNIQVTEEHKVMTYRNIHNEKKYEVQAGVMINYVLNKLDYNFTNNIEFEQKDLLEEAVAYTYKKLTGETIGRSLEIGLFREKYRLYALGGSQRVSIYPNINTLIKLATNSPYIINYIDDRLIYRHVRSLKNYANELNHRFGNIVRKNPKLKNKLNRYISCIETAIKYITRMYKDIRIVMNELDVEYRRIFREIITIDNSLKTSELNESATFNPVIFNLNSIYKESDNLVNSILTENAENQNPKKESLESLKESLFKTHKSFLTDAINKLQLHERMRINIKNDTGLVANITQEECDRYPVYTLSGVNTPITTNIQNVLTKYMMDRGKDINELPDSKELVKIILQDVDLLKDCYTSTEEGQWLKSTLDNIDKSLAGNSKYLTLDVESLANNLITIPHILKEIDETTELICKSISSRFDTITNKIENSECNIKEDIEKTVKYFCVYNEILNCIYKNLESIAVNSIDAIKNIIENKI